MALAATKLVLEAGEYFRYEKGPSGIPVGDGWWTVETGYYYYFDNDHKVPKTSLKERKNQKFRLSMRKKYAMLSMFYKKIQYTCFLCSYYFSLRSKEVFFKK